MFDDYSPKSIQTLTIVSGKPGWAPVFLATLIVLAIAGLASGIAAPRDPAGAIVILVVILCVLVFRATVQWIAEIDQVARRLTISKRRLGGRLLTVTARCSFDECSEVGAVQYTDPVCAKIYLKLGRGGKYEIPVEGSNFNEAAKIASELSSLTGIPRGLDRFSN
ncbi:MULTISPECIES: hypothetical protein [unclassified Bradyrhizobium]|uniref:hypothetical protein n=1 Tax=unclassified Bradyrhizobium TaxID=2631580 RepID=UPI002915E577|nr:MULTISPECIES: hypothetical protein [unclassified Bradyrhizobium]